MVKEYKVKMIDLKGKNFERPIVAKNLSEVKSKVNRIYNIKKIKSIKLWRTWKHIK